MALPSWWQVTTPHKDIVEERFNEYIFAADLGDVVKGKGPLEYQDGALFFDKTYLTKGLEQLFTMLLARLSGTGKGESVIQLQTPFGGGKTHALLGLYHLFENGNDLKHTTTIEYLLGVAELEEVPPINVAALVSLGFTRREAFRKINDLKRSGELEGGVEKIIRLALSKT
ncbi:MAG: hypothetical protein IIB44_10735 [Candidatus Marinimicrobia bacterium]|nr:hypothetical protein [Candidatus Neomarinimicrobiota bacterium]